MWAASMILNVLTPKEIDHRMGASPGQLLHTTEVQRTKGIVAWVRAGRSSNSSGQGNGKPHLSLAEAGWRQVLVMWLGVGTC